MIPVIMSGGSGTRLWPLSRKHKPKQFIALFGDNAMFQNTLTRLEGIIVWNYRLLWLPAYCNKSWCVLLWVNH